MIIGLGRNLRSLINARCESMDDQDVDTKPVGSSCDRELLRTRERVSTKANINHL
jgi:hypothetical protein